MLSKSFRPVTLATVKTTTRISRCCMGTYKSSTGLPGVDVDPNGRENLIKLSEKVLESVKKIPETAAYRTHVQQWFTFIKKTANEMEDYKAIEQEINLGQIEEVIQMCKTELEVIDFYYDNKIWEAVEEAKATADEMVADMHESIYFNTERSPTNPLKPPEMK